MDHDTLQRFTRHDEHGDYVPWTLEFDMTFGFEIETAKLAHLLPPGLSSVEPVPGMSILVLGYCRFPPGSPAGDRPIHELSLGVMINPDLSDPRLPKYAFYTVNILSDSAPFLDWAERIDALPVCRAKEVTVDVDYAVPRLAVATADGPVCRLQTTAARPRFRPSTFYLQNFFAKGEGTRRALIRWSGQKFEHQRPGDAGQLYAHPFFLGVDVASARAHIQMYTEPGTLTEMRFYAKHSVVTEPSASVKR